MIDTKFVCTLAALVASVVVICNYDKKENFVENFAGSAGGMPQFEVRAEKVMACNEQAAARGEFFSVPNFQAQLSPRMFSESYGPNINYNQPALPNLGVPANPLAAKEPFNFAKMARENYMPKQSCGTAASGDFMADPVMRANYHNGNWSAVTFGGGNEVRENFGKGGKSPLAMAANAAANPSAQGVGVAANAMLPAQPVAPTNAMAAANMSGVALPQQNITSPLPAAMIAAAAKVDPNADPSCLCAGQEGEPIVYDRYIIANRNNRLRAQGDPIRGDLPIAKTNTGWFQTSAKPDESLNPGAINVMAGHDNETSKQMTALLYAAKGGANADSAVGGTVLTKQQMASALGQPASDVAVIQSGLGA